MGSWLDFEIREVKNSEVRALKPKQKTVASYSHSKIATYEQCPQKYKFRYIDGIEPLKRTIEAFMGDLVHRTLAKLYEDLHVSRLDACKEILGFYKQQWDSSFTPRIKVVRAGTSPQDYFESGKAMIQSYYRRFQPFNQAATLALELDATFPLAAGTDFHGVIDRVAKVSDDSYEIHDYKTSRRLPPREQFNQDRQLPLYEIAFRHVWPAVKRVTLVWHYLAFDHEYRIRKRLGELDRVKHSTLKLIRTIEAVSSFPTHESPLCDWCEYYDICPAKQHMPGTWTRQPSISVADRVKLSTEEKRALDRKNDSGPLLSAFRFICYALGSLIRVILAHIRSERQRPTR